MSGRDALYFLVGFLAIVGSYGPLSRASTPTLEVANMVTTERIVDRLNRTIQNEKDKIFRRLMGLEKRCVDRTDSCPYYYNGYFYQTPWWTAPAIY